LHNGFRGVETETRRHFIHTRLLEARRVYQRIWEALVEVERCTVRVNDSALIT
jgi:hypothetical protein